MEKDILTELGSSITELETKYAEIELKIDELEEELGNTIGSQDTADIKKSIEINETKKANTERLIYDLKLKRTELSYLQGDNTHKNSLTKISLISSLIISIVLICLTALQNCTNNDLVAVGILESVHSHGEIQREVERIDKVCGPLVEKNDVAKYRESIDRITNLNQSVETKLKIFEKKYEKEIQHLKKQSPNP